MIWLEILVLKLGWLKEQRLIFAKVKSNELIYYAFKCKILKLWYVLNMNSLNIVFELGWS